MFTSISYLLVSIFAHRWGDRPWGVRIVYYIPFYGILGAAEYNSFTANLWPNRGLEFPGPLSRSSRADRPLASV